MRTTTTLFLAVKLIAAVAQPAGGSLFFDGTDELYLDSIYPVGCWQVGHPNKPVFTSAYSEPNALVTDTLLPHMDSTTCYAQFTMVAEQADVLGKWIEFDYWSDMDSLQSFGWIEKQNAYTTTWARLPISDAYDIWFESSGELWTDSGAVFTGSTFGWHHASLHIECLGVLMEENMDRGGGWSDTIRLRFAFRGAANTQARDGWMIDNIQATPVQCSGGIEKQVRRSPTIYPMPTNSTCTFEAGIAEGTPYEIRILRGDGALVHREKRVNYGIQMLDVSRLVPGPYVLIVRDDTGDRMGRLVISR